MGRKSGPEASAIPDGVAGKIHARIDRFEPALSPRKWGLEGVVQNACCHAVLLENGDAHISLRHGVIGLAGPALIWLPAGEGRVCDIEAGARGYVMSVPDDVVARSLSGHFPPDQARQGAGHFRGLRFVADTVHGSHLTDHKQDFEQTRLIFAVMASEIWANRHMGETVFSAQLIALLAILARLAEDWMTQGLQEGTGSGVGSVTLHRFLQVLEIHFRDHWNVGDYARALGTSERRLALATVRATGKPPLQLIHDRVLHEACLRLEQSPQAVAQVAYGLGFRDPAYFNRFFKRYLGVAPGAWRRQKRAGQIRDDTSFAAWP
ncbi:AraC family transcriptional regulator [Thalassospira sp. TSL5-1]|uniref:helix-turn-helix domain-containing protein n=1 Tax=Thalassospira sp. TSL5-1 TaxID=1544451 RepID=UPI00093942BE|nr:AraC family transcriptional regulator [Thalassospira sp. TSL5-1]